MGRQRHSLPAGVLAAAALPHVQVAAVALRGAKHKRRDRQQERVVLEGTSTSLTACLQSKVTDWVHRWPALQHHTTKPQ